MTQDFAAYMNNLQTIEETEFFPISILNDINLLYSYTEEEFIIRGLPVIENMIYNVVNTPIGTREWEPTFGSKILAMIHEQNVIENLEILDMELFSAVRRWVPYCNLMFRQTFSVSYPDQGLVTTYINYIDIFHQLPRTFSINVATQQLIG